MLNAMAWALACFGVVAADIALSVVLFSVLDAVSVLTGYPIDNLDIQWFQAAAQTASFLMALLWWRYLWPRSFMARRQGERPLGGGASAAWKRIACVVVIGLALQVVVGYVTDAVLSLLPDAAADYSELVEETGMGDTSYLAVLTTVLGAPFCEELLVRGIFLSFRSERLIRSAAHFGSARVVRARRTAPWCPGRPQVRGVSPRRLCCRRQSSVLCT
ncbi:hypothetical protein [Collinsella sp. AM34-10]|uniref:hypothetical protein n=1 Tax=Collinsella sp. AM34-10 TaxID=2292316 RepID=UPI0011C22D64|nr:hypothetical protein [Collinsella sp. AM34-10]